jgi:hypothetical protein
MNNELSATTFYTWLSLLSTQPHVRGHSSLRPLLHFYEQGVLLPPRALVHHLRQLLPILYALGQRVIHVRCTTSFGVV